MDRISVASAGSPSGRTASPHSAARSHVPTAAPQGAVVRTSAFQVYWAKHLDEVRQAQQLRYRVFAQEMGASMSTALAGHDVDHWDDYCEHLLVRDRQTNQVVGTYRLLTPPQARRAGRLYIETEFDCAALAPWRASMAELGRSCVHPAWRSGAVMLALWSELAGFMHRNHLHTMVGCASLPMQQAGMRYGEAPARIWAQLPAASHCAPAWRVQPHVPFPLQTHLRKEDAASKSVVSLPPLVHGYLRMGAKVLGPPAWDPDFQTADLPIMLHVHALPARYQRTRVS